MTQEIHHQLAAAAAAIELAREHEALHSRAVELVTQAGDDLWAALDPDRRVSATEIMVRRKNWEQVSSLLARLTREPSK